MLDLVDPVRDARGVQLGVFALQPDAGLLAENAGGGQPLVRQPPQNTNRAVATAIMGDA